MKRRGVNQRLVFWLKSILGWQTLILGTLKSLKNNQTMKNQKIFFLIVLISLIILSSCKHEIDKPPLVSNPATYPILDSSTIQIPIRITAYSVKRAVLNSLDNPIASGNTGEIGIKLLATEQISEEELIKELVKPATPGYWKDVTVETFETVKESFSCALTPWRWGTCWKDVTKKVLKTVKVWVEPTEAVYRYASKPVTKLIDKVYPVHAKINYTAYVTDVDLRFIGNNVNTTTYFKVKLSLDYEQAAIPLGPTIKLKGLLTCELEAKLDLKASISINDSKEIKCAVDEDATNLTFTKICIPGAVETLDIVQYLNPYLLGSRIALGKIIDKTINDKIIEAIDKNQSKLTFKQQYDSILAQVRKPIKLGENLWLSPNITQAHLSPFTGQGAGLQNEMRVTVGFVAYPAIIYSADTPAISGPEILPFTIKALNDPSVNLFVANRLDYAIASQIIDTELNDAISSLRSKYDIVDKWLQKRKYYVGNVQIYPNGKKLVVGVDILKRKNSKKVITLYLLAIPAYNQAKSYFYFDDIEFTLETKKYLLKALKNVISIDIVEQAIKKEITKNSMFDVSKEYKMITDTLRDIKVTKSNIDIAGSFAPFSITQIFPTTKDLVVYATLKGKLSLLFNPLHQLADNNLEILSPKTVGINEELRLPAELISAPDQSKIFNMTKAIHEGPIKKPKEGDVFKSKSHTSLYAKQNTNKVLIDGKFIPSINIGDTIYFEQGNTISFRIAELKDKTIPGDTILVRDNSGKLNVYIIR